MFTVQDLIDIELLKLTPIAGTAGTGRQITWAHAVDLPDPWRWISPGDLVMTTGVGIPAKAADQVVWVEKLVQANASALVVAPRKNAPALSRSMLDSADRLHLPILQGSFELEFVKLSHYVIESVLQAQRERFNASEKLFQTYAEALRRETDLAGRLCSLAQTLGLGLAVEDAPTGDIIVKSDKLVTQGPVERIPIGGRTRANLLIARHHRTGGDDTILVRSLVGLLAVELERLMIQRDQQRQEGSGLLHSLLENETELTLAGPLLKRHGLNGTLVMLVIDTDGRGAWQAGDIHQAPALHQTCPLLLYHKHQLLALTTDEYALVEGLRTSLGESTVIGISGPINAATGFRESLRQASLALAQAHETGAVCLRYGEVESGLVLAPKTMAEARALVGRYLGPLIEHDRSNGAALLNTLTTFLNHDGNWKSSAFRLGIHRQTLVYRLKLVEQLTGLKPTTTQGIARFWIAIQAASNTELLDWDK